MFARRDFLAALAGLGTGLSSVMGCAHRQGGSPASGPSFVARRAEHQTLLSRDAPSTGRWRADAEPPAGAEAIRYPSEDGDLLAYYGAPRGEGAGERGAPALVYFHGEFSLRPSDFDKVRAFLDAGFAVLTPSLRGENGNPGRMELLYGELADARAAIRWLIAQPGIDGERVFSLGHSIGGGLSALLSLDPEVPLVATASAGGIYVPETFVRWGRNSKQSELIRFDPGDREERELRCLGPHVADMLRPHIAYVGDGDPWIMRNAEAVRDAAAEHHELFDLQVVAGDHGAMIRPAVTEYLGRVAELRGSTPP